MIAVADHQDLLGEQAAAIADDARLAVGQIGRGAEYRPRRWRLVGVAGIVGPHEGHHLSAPRGGARQAPA